MYDAETVRVREVCCLVISVHSNLVNLYIYNRMVAVAAASIRCVPDAGGGGPGQGGGWGGAEQGWCSIGLVLFT